MQLGLGVSIILEVVIKSVFKTRLKTADTKIGLFNRMDATLSVCLLLLTLNLVTRVNTRLIKKDGFTLRSTSTEVNSNNVNNADSEKHHIMKRRSYNGILTEVNSNNAAVSTYL
uniref:Uncharacterized protein n=1 Tax=Cacopsylla melanoneura TaxID=428564 RepID=A0A8D9ER82_9HEMI